MKFWRTYFTDTNWFTDLLLFFVFKFNRNRFLRICCQEYMGIEFGRTVGIIYLPTASSYSDTSMHLRREIDMFGALYEGWSRIILSVIITWRTFTKTSSCQRVTSIMSYQCFVSIKQTMIRNYHEGTQFQLWYYVIFFKCFMENSPWCRFMVSWTYWNVTVAKMAFYHTVSVSVCQMLPPLIDYNE